MTTPDKAPDVVVCARRRPDRADVIRKSERRKSVKHDFIEPPHNRSGDTNWSSHDNPYCKARCQHRSSSMTARMNSTESSIRQCLDRFTVDATSRSGGPTLAYFIQGCNANGSGLSGWRGTKRLEFVPHFLFRHTSRHTRNHAIGQITNNDGRFQNRPSDMGSVGQTITTII